MTDITAKKVILKDKDGRYLIPFVDSAISATKDSNGNIISLTYATKTELSEKQNDLIPGIGITLDNNIVSIKDIFQEIINVSSSTITLHLGKSIYKKNIQQDTTFLFDISELGNLENKSVTFELYLNMETAHTLMFPSNIVWIVEPDFSAVGSYLLVFRSMDSGNTWLGNLSAFWE